MAAADSRASGLRGREQPRLFPQPLRRLTRRTTLGYDVIDFAEAMLGMDLLPWQRWWLLRALELDGGGFRWRTILTLVGRQNGKTHLLKVLALALMYLGHVRMVLGAAQSLDIARESWSGAVDLAMSDPELRAEIDTVRRANGEQELRLTNGARYRIAAATRSAGRGLSVDLLILDELREHRDWLAWAALSKTTIARPNALIVAISNAGDDQSVVLNSLRAAAIGGDDPTLALFEWSAPDDCEINDPDAWAHANPGLGHTVSERAIRAALSTDPPAVFRTEVLCQRVESLDNAIDPAAWQACRDPLATLDKLRDRVAAVVDVAPDSEHATLVAAAVRGDGRIVVEPVAAWTSTEDARDELPELIASIRPAAVGWLPSGPAAVLAPLMRQLGAREITGARVVEACMGFADLVAAGRIVHAGDPLLSAQIAGAQRYRQGDGWRFTRSGSGHVDAAYAAAGAVQLAQTLPRPVRPRIIAPRTATA